MELEYFMLDIGKIIIYRKNGIKTYYKEVDNKFYILNDSEYEYVESIFNDEGQSDYRSEILNTLIDNNKHISSNDKIQITDLLTKIEQFIPSNCTDNFYRNIKTLKVNLNLNPTFTKDEITAYKEKFKSGNNIPLGDYNVKDNALYLFKDGLKYIYAFKDDPDGIIKNSIAHELLHMASSKKGLFTNSLCGLDCINFHDKSKRNRGLTEGLTELFANCIAHENYCLSNYIVEMFIVKQLMLIVGSDIIYESYFLNYGTTKLESELNQLVDDPELASSLFRRIEDNFKIRNLNSKQSILSNIQTILIFYFQNKLFRMLKTDNIDTVFNYINRYEESLITDVDLFRASKDPTLYDGLDESVKKFYELKKYMLYNYAPNKGGISK